MMNFRDFNCLLLIIAIFGSVLPAAATSPKPPIFDVKLSIQAGNPLSGSLTISSSKRVKDTNATIQLFSHVQGYRPEDVLQAAHIDLGQIAPGKPASGTFTLNLPPPGVYALNVRAKAELLEPWMYPTEDSFDPFFLAVGTTTADVLTASEFRELQNNGLLGKNKRATPPWGSALDGLKIFVQPLQTSYGKDDPLRFEISFQNVSKQTILLSDYMFGDLQWRLQIDGKTKKNVRRPDGTLVQNLAFAKYQQLQNLLPNGFLELSPGKSWKTVVTVDPEIAKELRDYEYNEFRAYHLYSTAMLPFFKTDPKIQNIWTGNVLSEDPGPSFVLE